MPYRESSDNPVLNAESPDMAQHSATSVDTEPSDEFWLELTATAMCAENRW